MTTSSRPAGPVPPAAPGADGVPGAVPRSVPGSVSGAEPRAGAGPAAEAAPRRRAALVFDDPLGRTARDDSDEGWGDRTAGGGAGDLARFLDEKPPHHL